MRRAVFQQPLPLPQIGTQPRHFRLRPETGSKQTVLVQPLKPLRVADVGLPSRHVLGVTRVDHHHLEAALFKDLEDRDPINTGRLHHHCSDPATGKPVRQPVKIIGECVERPHRFLITIRADGRDMDLGANIDRRRPGMNTGHAP